MREIKLRAWTGAVMEYRVMAGWLGAFYVQGIDEKDTACMSPFNTKYGEQTPIMQFTGLLDRHGKEIYEGDVYLPYLSYKAGDDMSGESQKGGPSIVQYAAPKFVAIEQRPGAREIWHSFEGPPMGEVIGNIYENPNLLK